MRGENPYAKLYLRPDRDRPETGGSGGASSSSQAPPRWVPKALAPTPHADADADAPTPAGRPETGVLPAPPLVLQPKAALAYAALLDQPALYRPTHIGPLCVAPTPPIPYDAGQIVQVVNEYRYYTNKKAGELTRKGRRNPALRHWIRFDGDPIYRRNMEVQWVPRELYKVEDDGTWVAAEELPTDP